MRDWFLVLLTVVCLVLCAVMYVDNRHLLDDMARVSGRCVPPETHQILLEACESIVQVNKREQAYLRRITEVVDEQQRADGKVRSAAGQGGVGGGREGGKTGRP